MTTTTDIAEGQPDAQLTAKDFKGPVNPDWCAGCGDFGVLNSLQRVCAELGLKPHELLIISGIGCSSNLPGYFNAYGMHTLHGRALAVATGAKMGNHELNVIVTVGDGDGYGIGGNHFVHTARRNVDLTYVVMNNQVYGLTTGQVSPTTTLGMKTKSTPFGSVEMPVNPIAAAIMNGATFVARGFSGDIRHLTELIRRGSSTRGLPLLTFSAPALPSTSRIPIRFSRSASRNSRMKTMTPATGKPPVRRLWYGAIRFTLDYSCKGKLQLLASRSLCLTREAL